MKLISWGIILSIFFNSADMVLSLNFLFETKCQPESEGFGSRIKALSWENAQKQAEEQGSIPV